MKYQIVTIKTCKYRRYITNDIEGWGRGFCKHNNKICPCIMPPSNKKSAKRSGCKKEYEPKTQYNIWFD